MKNNIIKLGFLILLGCSIVVSPIIAHKKGHEDGFKDGVITALDSVNAIATQQLNNKTISSKFYIQSTDTLEFILSPKTIKMKK